jgi:pyrimidine operon attenuation protein/uracil phosphoribosyltransferase
MDSFCRKIAKELQNISTLKVSLCEVKINKLNPELPIYLSDKEAYANKV